MVAPRGARHQRGTEPAWLSLRPAEDGAPGIGALGSFLLDPSGSISSVPQFPLI